MTTTIQVDDEIKKKLFEIKLKLEKEKGAAVTYNEIIAHLIENQYQNLKKRRKMKEFRKLKGVLPKSALEVYYQEKEKERINEEKIAPLTDNNRE
jgi:hypothetical protein